MLSADINDNNGDNKHLGEPLSIPAIASLLARAVCCNRNGFGARLSTRSATGGSNGHQTREREPAVKVVAGARQENTQAGHCVSSPRRWALDAERICILVGCQAQAAAGLWHITRDACGQVSMRPHSDSDKREAIGEFFPMCRRPSGRPLGRPRRGKRAGELRSEVATGVDYLAKTRLMRSSAVRIAAGGFWRAKSWRRALNWRGKVSLESGTRTDEAAV